MRKTIISRLLLTVCLLLSTHAFAALDITVEPHKGWGPAPISNIKRLCENVALHFQEQFRDEHKLDGELTIVYHTDVPIAFYRSYFGGGPNEYKIGLSVTDTYWDKFSYQFAHEFCHIMHNHDLTPGSSDKNAWFQEALCELATVWVMRRMSETWAYRTPYPNWVSYRHHLKSYADRRLNRAEAQYDGTAEEWLKEWESKLRNQGETYFSYARVSQLSYKFLPIFEENPEAWNAVRQLPTSSSQMQAYMKEWYREVDIEDKEWVKAIAEEMGITVESIETEILAIDADVNDDGYVDLYDVMIVRSGMTNQSTYDTDVNNDGATNILDLLLVKAKAVEAIAAAAPTKRKIDITTWGSIKRR